MNRITCVEIAGKEYPMSFSLMATKKIAGKYGSVEKMLDALNTKDGIKEKTIEEITDLLELLIAQGCAYKNYFEKDVPTKEKDPVVDGKWTPLPREALEIAIGIGDLEEIAGRIEECVTKSKKKEVKAHVIEIKGKEEAGQV